MDAESAVSNANGGLNLEPSVTIKAADLDALGENFEKTTKGFVDFLLLDPKGFPLIVLEATAEDKNPLIGKEQARKYARSQNCRFVILSSGNLHYFWDLERGNPYVIISFPTPDSAIGYQKVAPDPRSVAVSWRGGGCRCGPRSRPARSIPRRRRSRRSGLRTFRGIGAYVVISRYQNFSFIASIFRVLSKTAQAL